jgi:hypothetical protein
MGLVALRRVETGPFFAASAALISSGLFARRLAFIV